MPESLSAVLAAESLAEAVEDVAAKRAAYEASLAERDRLIRESSAHLSSPRIEAITGLSRETISRVRNRRRGA